MSKVKSLIAYTAAVLCIFAVVLTFVGNDFLAKKLVDVTGVKVSPIYTGGEIIKTVPFQGYDMKIHETVFQGLFSDRKDGFIQVDWIGSKIPKIISQKVDFDNDGKGDFFIEYDTSKNKTNFKSLNKEVVSIKEIYKIKEGYAVRINLKR